ncbi:hypothetical protein [Mesorhizobium sp. 131-2-1]|uniref:hypothetical protein n=1 Tax=Mesorhizobium sp. 131-2-1 TaxID=2744518 RepID=UPI001928DB1B|nr:hypothetical protein [Mesorhizobium sp. 131-2-1]BCG91423.1 hypothetical protein MesoLj131a_02870 [Mesorhizobium sp. 131-2-1]
MRALLVASLSVWSLNSFAFDGPKVAKEFDAAFDTCRMVQTRDGRDLSKPEWDRICAKRDRLAASLKAHHYCWNNSEYEWALCKK